MTFGTEPRKENRMQKKCLAMLFILLLAIVSAGCASDKPAVQADETAGVNENLLETEWAYDTSSIEIAETETGNNYIVLYDALESGQAYTFSAASIDITEGDASGISVLVYDEAEHEIYDRSVLPAGEQISYSFTVPERSDSCSLIVYAGVMGQTMGNSVVLQKAKLERGTTATTWQAIEFSDKNLLLDVGTYDPASFDVPKADSESNNMRLYYDLHPGRTYLFSVDNLEVTEGSTGLISVIVFDNTNKKICSRFDFTPDTGGLWVLIVPEEEGIEYQLIIFTGEPGASNGISLNVTGAVLKERVEA
mgnify:CR=1 FL=1